MCIARESHAIVYHNDRIYTFGTNKAAEMFSIENNVWTKLENMPFTTR